MRARHRNAYTADTQPGKVVLTTTRSITTLPGSSVPDQMDYKIISTDTEIPCSLSPDEDEANKYTIIASSKEKKNEREREKKPYPPPVATADPGSDPGTGPDPMVGAALIAAGVDRAGVDIFAASRLMRTLWSVLPFLAIPSAGNGMGTHTRGGGGGGGRFASLLSYPINLFGKDGGHNEDRSQNDFDTNQPRNDFGIGCLEHGGQQLNSKRACSE